MREPTRESASLDSSLPAIDSSAPDGASYAVPRASTPDGARRGGPRNPRGSASPEDTGAPPKRRRKPTKGSGEGDDADWELISRPTGDSPAWKYFELNRKILGTEQRAVCTTCRHSYAWPGATSQLLWHMEKRHPELLQGPLRSPDPDGTSKPKRVYRRVATAAAGASSGAGQPLLLPPPDPSDLRSMHAAIADFVCQRQDPLSAFDPNGPAGLRQLLALLPFAYHPPAGPGPAPTPAEHAATGLADCLARLGALAGARRERLLSLEARVRRSGVPQDTLSASEVIGALFGRTPEEAVLAFDVLKRIYAHTPPHPGPPLPVHWDPSAGSAALALAAPSGLASAPGPSSALYQMHPASAMASHTGAWPWPVGAGASSRPPEREGEEGIVAQSQP